MEFLKGKMGTQVFLHFFQKRNVNFLSHERNYLINILHELNSILQSELIKDHTTLQVHFLLIKNKKLFQYTSWIQIYIYSICIFKILYMYVKNTSLKVQGFDISITKLHIAAHIYDGKYVLKWSTAFLKLFLSIKKQQLLFFNF